MDANNLREVAADVLQFEILRGEWDGIIGRTVPQRVGLIAEEASEVFKAYRQGHPVTETWLDDKGKPEGIPIELADIVLRTLATAEGWGIDLMAAIVQKMDYNWERRFPEFAVKRKEPNVV